MASFIIDLMDDEVSVDHEEDFKEIVQRNLMWKKALEERFRRTSEIALQIVPSE